MRNVTVLALVVSLGCGSSSENGPVADAGPTADAFDTAPPPEGTVRFKMELSVPKGTETHKCMMVKMPAQAGVVVGMRHHYTQGSHHLLLFRTDVTSIPSGLDTMIDCYEGARGVMGYVRGIYYGSQIPDDETKLPEGVGLEYRAGEVLLFQSHYINTTERSIDAHVTVDLATAPRASVSQLAGTLFFYDPFISVPVDAKASAQMRCTIPRDIRVVSGFSHYHERGSLFEAFIDPSGGRATKPFYTSTDWEHPEPLHQAVDVPGGSAIRFRCDYDNLKGTAEYYQGESAKDNEMCIFSAVYYPRLDTDAEWCLVDPDMFGTGTSSCAATLLCLSGCADATVPPIGSSGPVEVDPCLQRCVVDSCENASGILLNGLTCLAAHCLGACGLGGAECLECLRAKCPTEVDTCLKTPCSP